MFRGVPAVGFGVTSGRGGGHGGRGVRSRITEEAEQAVAAYFGFDECLFLPSGYQGNLACAMALIHAGQPVFVDRRVHASIARGLVLGKADVRTYAHADYGHLERRLASRYSRW